jgi:hypothetical protein
MLIRIMAIVLLGVAPVACAEEPVVEEYQVKGEFLLNFTKFVEWPAEAFKGPGDPIAICVLGKNPFGPGLERAAQGAVAANRRVSVRQISDGQQARECQIVFVSASERRRWRALLDVLRGRRVLTVGEWDGFLATGGMVAFKLEAEKVRMEISSEAADRAGLHISAKLLSLAQSGRR